MIFFLKKRIYRLTEQKTLIVSFNYFSSFVLEDRCFNISCIREDYIYSNFKYIVTLKPK